MPRQDIPGSNRSITAQWLRRILADKLYSLHLTKNMFSGSPLETRELVRIKHATAIHFTKRAIEAVQIALDDELHLGCDQ